MNGRLYILHFECISNFSLYKIKSLVGQKELSFILGQITDLCFTHSCLFPYTSKETCMYANKTSLVWVGSCSARCYKISKISVEVT